MMRKRGRGGRYGPRPGPIDLFQILQLQASQLATESEVIEPPNALLANRVGLHLALGGSSDAKPAVAIVK
jgi:hypothetical protein